MTQVQDIRKLYFKEGMNISQISKETGRDRKTVRMYLEKDDWNEAIPSAPKDSTFPKLSSFKSTIDQWLEEDRKAKRKQRHTAQRVYNRLVECFGEEFTCSYRTVAAYVATRKKSIYGKQDGYLPLEHIPGEAQVDFGDADYYEKGQLFNGKYLNLSFPYSNQGYFQLTRGENQECLFEALITLFDHLGGVPRRIWFDNASTMVVKVLKQGKRDLTSAFIRFAEHYRFEFAFCNVESGHEKGNVERKVGYHRSNMLVPIPRFESLAAFNKEQLSVCDRDGERDHYRKNATIAELFKADQAALLDLPAVPLDVSTYVTVRTNGYGRFYLHNGMHEYSVSPKYAKCKILVKVTATEVIPLDDSHREIVRHERCYGEHRQQRMQWLPYLTQLSRSPGALKYSGIYAMLPESVQQFLERCDKGEKGKVLQALAALTEKNGFESAVATVNDALAYDAADTDSLLNLHRRMHSNVVELAPIRLTSNIPDLKRVTPDLAAYDNKLGKAGG